MYHSSVLWSTILGKHLMIRRRHLHACTLQSNAQTKMKIFQTFQKNVGGWGRGWGDGRELFYKIGLVTCKGVICLVSQIKYLLLWQGCAGPNLETETFAESYSRKKLWWSPFLNTCSLCFFKKNSNTGVFLMTFAKFWRTLLNSCFKEIAKKSKTEWRKRVKFN